MLFHRLILIAASVAAANAQSSSRYTISTLAGNGTLGFSGDGGAAAAAQLYTPYGIAVNASGVVYVADQANQRIRQVNGGTISTFAGSGTKGYSGDGAQAASAALSTPAGVAVDASGNVYFSDTGNQVIRKITTGGVISTVAGSNSLGAGFAGDGAAATSAQLNTPLGVAVDATGAIYVADYANNRVRKIANGNINTVAGSGGVGYWGDGGQATAAGLNGPTGVAIDAAGFLYIADTGNNRIRKVAGNGIITTVAGTGNPSYSGDLGPAINADLDGPTGVTVDPGGVMYIADNLNSRIRRVSTASTISTIAGNGKEAYTGDGGLGTDASVFFPIGVAVDKVGNVYVADTQNHVTRQLAPIADFALPPAVTGVIGAGGFGGFQAVAAGSWVEIYGSDLATTARSWTGSDFHNQLAPTMVDGTTVMIGGIPAPISYISGGQLNALVPTGLGSGQQTLTVTTLVGTSAAVNITIAPNTAGLYAPQFLNSGGTQYAAGLLSDGSYAAPANVSATVKSRPAKAGETVTLYGTGFGPVTPNVPTGQIAPASTALTGQLSIALGGLPATVTYAGLAPGGVGLYQINIVVPAGLTSGAAPLTFLLNGQAGSQSLSLAVGN
jgi:uncharacterized protein (TIGR03437 family)